MRTVKKVYLVTSGAHFDKILTAISVATGRGCCCRCDTTSKIPFDSVRDRIISHDVLMGKADKRGMKTWEYPYLKYLP